MNKEQKAKNMHVSQHSSNEVLPAVLHLTLKKKWYEMILAGEKKEEYREVKRFWICRLLKNLEYLTDLEGVKNVGANFKRYDVIEFKNGYAKNAPTMIVEFTGLRIDRAKPKWSDGWQEEVFVISLGAVLHSR